MIMPMGMEPLWVVHYKGNGVYYFYCRTSRFFGNHCTDDWHEVNCIVCVALQDEEAYVDWLNRYG